MATAAYPLRATLSTTYLETWCAGPQRRAVGKVAVIHMSDGSTVKCCDRPHGHVKQSTLVACATARVAQLNDAAGIPEQDR